MHTQRTRGLFAGVCYLAAGDACAGRRRPLYKRAGTFAADGGLMVGAMSATTNYDVAARLVGEDRIASFTTFPQAVDALVTGDVDAVVIDDMAGRGYIGENTDKVQVAGEPLIEVEELGFIFAKGSNLVQPFNAALNNMRADDTLDTINEKWWFHNI